MKRVRINFWACNKFEDLNNLGIKHKDVYDLDQDEIYLLVENILDLDYYVKLKKNDNYYYLYIDDKRFTQR